MKKILYFLILCSITIPALAQQNDKYIAAMQKNLAGLDSAFKNPEAMLALANSFNRIGEAENTMAALLLCCLLPGKLWLYAVGKKQRPGR